MWCHDLFIKNIYILDYNWFWHWFCIILLQVDGDTSTNDTVIALASGLSGLSCISSLDSDEAIQLQACLDAVMSTLYNFHNYFVTSYSFFPVEQNNILMYFNSCWKLSSSCKTRKLIKFYELCWSYCYSTFWHVIKVWFWGQHAVVSFLNVKIVDMMINFHA